MASGDRVEKPLPAHGWFLTLRQKGAEYQQKERPHGGNAIRLENGINPGQNEKRRSVRTA
jgi:hypothetical protein